MQISVSGKNIKVGDALRQHVNEALEKGISKYFDRAIHADVVVTKETHLFCTDIIVNQGTGTKVIIKGRGESGDVYASFDQAASRIEKQLRRYKRRLKNHSKRPTAENVHEILEFEARKYVLADSGEEEAAEEDNPLIIAEKPTAIETLTVSDAVMKMDLANLPALMFINKKNGGVNVVYRRHDGNISWVDTGRKFAA